MFIQTHFLPLVGYRFQVQVNSESLMGACGPKDLYSKDEFSLRSGVQAVYLISEQAGG